MLLVLQSHAHVMHRLSCLVSRHAALCIHPFRSAIAFILVRVYWVLTSESASTVMCSLVSSALTLSAGNSALYNR